MRLLLAALCFAVPATSQAYIDPGTGSLAIQAVIAGVAGASVGLRAGWQHLKAFVSRLKSRPAAEDQVRPPSTT